MEKAKQAVKDFTSRAGHHDTTVHERANPAVTNETVTPTRHEEAQTVVDREVHQDHYHTTVQPVKDREVLPEQHTHNLAGTEHREYNHEDSSRTKERLAAEAGQFRDTTTTGSTRETSSVAPTVGGEHVHHHVHETIQPVVQKETVQPSVVHTTVPVHEVHHNEAKHHATSALPAVSMSDFKQQGGSLSGREERTDRFEGEPRNESATNHGVHSGTGTQSTGLGSSTTGHSSGTSGPHGSNLANKADPRIDSDRDGSRTAGNTGSTGYGSSTGTGVGSGVGSGNTGLGHSNAASANQTSSGIGHSEEGKTKPSLMDKLNPSKDSNGDGKAGFMK